MQGDLAAHNNRRGLGRHTCAREPSPAVSRCRLPHPPRPCQRLLAASLHGLGGGPAERCPGPPPRQRSTTEVPPCPGSRCRVTGMLHWPALALNADERTVSKRGFRSTLWPRLATSARGGVFARCVSCMLLVMSDVPCCVRARQVSDPVLSGSPQKNSKIKGVRHSGDCPFIRDCFPMLRAPDVV